MRFFFAGFCGDSCDRAGDSLHPNFPWLSPEFFLFQGSSAAKTGITRLAPSHLLTILLSLSLLPPTSAAQAGPGRTEWALSPLQHFGTGADGPACGKLGQHTPASKSSPLTVREALVASDENNLGKLLALCPHVALGSLQVAVSESRDQTGNFQGRGHMSPAWSPLRAPYLFPISCLLGM